MSPCNRDSKFWITAIPVARARAIQRCKALTVRGGAVVPGVGGTCLSNARNPIISDRITA
jgi:hypothetical protein